MLRYLKHFERFARFSSCFPKICSAARGVFDGFVRDSILAAHLPSLYVVGNITEYKKITHNSKSTLRTKDFLPSSASKKLVAAFLWSAKGEMS